MLSNKNNILIVDDEAPIMLALSDEFKNQGFNVFQAINGEEGLKMALQHNPDFIILDIMMPIMDGFTMLKQLRKDSWGKNALVLVLTNLDSNDHATEALENFAYDYLIKSDYSIENIVKLVKEKLNSHA